MWDFYRLSPTVAHTTHTDTHTTHTHYLFSISTCRFFKDVTRSVDADYFRPFFRFCFHLLFVQIDLNCLLRQRGGTKISQTQANKHDSDSHSRLMASSATIFPSPEPVRLCRRSTWTTPAPVFNHHFCCAVRTRCCSDRPAGTRASTPALCG